MAQRTPATTLALLLLLVVSQAGSRASESVVLPSGTTLAADICLDLPDAETKFSAQDAPAAAGSRSEGGVLDDAWPPDAIGGLLPPIRTVYDPFPTFDGLALDRQLQRDCVARLGEDRSPAECVARGRWVRGERSGGRADRLDDRHGLGRVEQRGGERPRANGERDTLVRGRLDE